MSFVFNLLFKEWGACGNRIRFSLIKLIIFIFKLCCSLGCFLVALKFLVLAVSPEANPCHYNQNYADHNTHIDNNDFLLERVCMDLFPFRVHWATLRLRMEECTSDWWLRLDDFVAAFFSYPRLDTIWLLSYFKYSRTPWKLIWSISAISCLATVGKVDSFIVTVVIVIMIMTSGDPFDCWLFNQSSKNTSIDWTTADIFISVSVKTSFVIHVHVLVNRNVNEK